MASTLSVSSPKSLFQTAEATRWSVVSFVLGLLGFWAVTTRRSKKSQTQSRSSDQDAASTDPGLLKKGTTFDSYTTPSGYAYPRIRTSYHEHPKARQLPNDFPLLVFMHGLGGSAAQFALLMNSLVNIAPCLAIDLPGCGLSDFRPDNVAAYTAPAFAELLCSVIERFRDKVADQKVVLIGHSMGCSVVSLLASSTSPLSHLCSHYVVGMIAICPRSSPLSAHELTAIRRLNWIPSRLFDLMRMADRRGGTASASVIRVVGREADLETRKLQLRFNEQSKSPVFQRFLQAMRLQDMTTASKDQDSLLGQRVWGGVKVPLFLIAAENDKLTSPREVEQIVTWLTEPATSTGDKSEGGILEPKSPEPDQDTPQSSADAKSDDPAARTATIRSTETEVVPKTMELIAGEATKSEPNETKRIGNDEGVNVESNQSAPRNKRPSQGSIVVKTSVFPAPASHGLMYATADARILSGLIENFLSKYVDERLSPGWQLQHLTNSGKWDVKNLKKWQSIDACSAPIGGIFRAMKTMREVDETHSPREFIKKYSYRVIPDGVAMVVDISHETPVYDQAGLESGGVDYYKLPTVSKLPPTVDEVSKFIALIDELRQSPKIQENRAPDGTLPTVGVHCHYGFNRTGLMIICYLVERLGWPLQEALDEFASKRAPGIKHEYFVNELYVRYAVKMERRGTVIAERGQ